MSLITMNHIFIFRQFLRCFLITPLLTNTLGQAKTNKIVKIIFTENLFM